MNAPRAVVLILSLGLVATAVVFLRREQIRMAAGLLRTESRWVELRSEWWSLQTQSAVLRTPERLRSRARFVHAYPRMLADSASSASDRLSDQYYDRSHLE